MAKIYVRGFQLLGTPEYVLARAGLLRVDVDRITACDKLTRLFRTNPMPPLEQVVPALVAVASRGSSRGSDPQGGQIR
jgi:hypothetical protein